MTEEPRREVDPNIEELMHANKALTQKLQAYEKLERDVAAEEIFEKKKKKRFMNWLTVGGLAALLAGALAIKSTQGYVEELAAKKVDAITSDKIQQLIQDHARSRIEALVDKEKEQLLTLGRQQVIALVAQLPIGRPQDLGSPTTVIAADATKVSVDLSNLMSPVGDQGAEGSTVGFAVAAAMEGSIAHATGRRVVLSPRYIYNTSKSGRGDIGAYIKDAVGLLKSKGAILESAWPYRAGEYDAPPPAGLANAERFRAGSTRETKRLVDIKAALQSGIPVVAGITLFSSFDTPNAGVIADPKPKESILGRHAICIVGYDDSTRLLKFKNSWSAAWGKAGYGFISYSYAEKNLSDAWAVTP